MEVDNIPLSAPESGALFRRTDTLPIALPARLTKESRMKENQNVEWKPSWRDDCLKWMYGFANADGGVLEIEKSRQTVALAGANLVK